MLFVGTQFSLSFHYTESDCVKWYVFQEVGTQLLIAGVESILIIRGMLSAFLPLHRPNRSFVSSTRPLRSQSQPYLDTYRPLPR